MEKNIPDKIYLLRGKYYATRGLTKELEVSDHYLVVAKDAESAQGKFLTHINEKFSRYNWEIFDSKELKKGRNVPLENRIRILGEVFERVK